MRAGQEDTGNTLSTTHLCPFTIRSNVQEPRSQQMVAFVVLLLGYQPDAAHMLQRLCFLSNLDLGLSELFWEGWRPGSPWQHLGKWRSQVRAARLGQRELLPARFQETGTETLSHLGKPERRSSFPLCRFQSALFFKPWNHGFSVTETCFMQSASSLI